MIYFAQNEVVEVYVSSAHRLSDALMDAANLISEIEEKFPYVHVGLDTGFSDEDESHRVNVYVHEKNTQQSLSQSDEE